jgi:hypothetical protein
MPHNGGRSQINLSEAQSGGAFPFINHMKAGQTWFVADGEGLALPSSLGANGFPTSIVSGGVGTVFFIPYSHRTATWKVRWRGTSVRVAATGGFDQTATDGEFTLDPGTDRIDLRIRAGTDISSLEFYHPDDEALLDAGKIFNTRFLDRLAYLRPGTIRDLDGQQNNISNIRYWADRKPLDYAYWHGDELRASMYAGETTNSGDAYSCSAPPGWTGLVDKAIVILKFNASSTGTEPTLDVDETGEKTIRDLSGVELHENLRPGIGRMATLIFDADLDVWLKFGGGVADDLNCALRNGLPYEVQIALCEELGAHPWFCRPYLSCDPITDWQTGIATLARDTCPPWSIPRFEVAPNETWNSAVGFGATRYAWLKAKHRWPATSTTNDHDWVGMVASTGGQAVSAVYGGDRTKYRAIVGVQAHGSTEPTARLASTLYVSEDSGSAASNWVHDIAPACYITHTYTTEELEEAASDFASADEAGKAVLAAALVDSVLVDEGGDQYRFSVPRLIDTIIPAFKTWAAGYGVGVTFYEGGWSPDYGGDAEINALYAASKAVPKLQYIIRDMYAALVDLGCEAPSHLTFTGDSAWALYDPDIYATPSPQAIGIHLFNRRQRGFKFRLT